MVARSGAIKAIRLELFTYFKASYYYCPGGTSIAMAADTSY